MATAHHRKKIMQGLSSAKSREKLKEIYAKEHDGADFQEVYPGVVPWMECWHQLRSRNETLDAICQSFAEKVSRLNKEKRVIEDRVHTQRLELLKRLGEIDKLKAAMAELADAPDRGSGVETHESSSLSSGTNTKGN